MNKSYVYRKWRIIGPYSAFILGAVVFSVPLVIVGARDSSGIIRNPFYLLCWVFPLFMLVVPILWMWNTLKTVIVLDDAGISKKDMFREEVRFRWHEIVRVDKKKLYEGDYNRYRPEPPQDLLIQGMDGRKIKVFRALRGLDSEKEGISDFERELFQRIDISKQPSKQRQGHEKRTGLLVLVCGLLTIIACIHLHRQGTVSGYFLIKLSFCGAAFCILGLYQLIKPSKATNKKEQSTLPDPELIKRTSDNSTAAERGGVKPVSRTVAELATGKAERDLGKKMAAVLNAVINIFIIGFVYIELDLRIIAHILAAVLVIESAVVFLYSFKSKQKKKGQPLTNPVDPE